MLHWWRTACLWPPFHSYRRQGTCRLFLCTSCRILNRCVLRLVEGLLDEVDIAQDFGRVGDVFFHLEHAVLDQGYHAVLDCPGPQLRDVGTAEQHRPHVGWEAETDSKTAWTKICAAGMAWKHFCATAAKFGLTPADRVKIKVSVESGGVDPFAEILALREKLN